MRVTIQRVKRAKCITNKKIVSEIEKGFLVLVGFTHEDTIDIVHKMARKIAMLRVFDDEAGKMNKAIKDVDGEILAISQFTLYADPLSGNRPSFTQSMAKDQANQLYLAFMNILNSEYQIKTLPGSFGEHMDLDILCDGPVTINIEL